MDQLSSRMFSVQVYTLCLLLNNIDSASLFGRTLQGFFNRLYLSSLQ
uniref:Uncharacterized protein n=1 Tax=Arundo donax TaxID=35708 RepID=A0A0A9EVX4_ARUDO